LCATVWNSLSGATPGGIIRSSVRSSSGPYGGFSGATRVTRETAATVDVASGLVGVASGLVEVTSGVVDVAFGVVDTGFLLCFEFRSRA
jgi:hypothetical protein